MLSKAVTDPNPEMK